MSIKVGSRVRLIADPFARGREKYPEIYMAPGEIGTVIQFNERLIYPVQRVCTKHPSTIDGPYALDEVEEVDE